MSALLRRGFTLIELLIVVVIIGVLAAIAIPRFADSKRKAQVAAMKTVLRRGMAEAEAYFADHGTYVGFVPTDSPPVRLSVALAEARRIGVVARHDHAPTATCMTYLGEGLWSYNGELMREGAISGRTCR
jgi:prepilin-type N-terminal cleavage/methylation domain-containing protein